MHSVVQKTQNNKDAKRLQVLRLCKYRMGGAALVEDKVSPGPVRNDRIKHGPQPVFFEQGTKSCTSDPWRGCCGHLI